ncbi:MAG: YihY/virulence factor BrkB family protein [Chlorobi bacterium]|nr:YihY/virulence factor BrkB family protein [Chlorobiota bacterium]
MKEKIKRFKEFLKNELWSVDVKKLSGPMRALVNFLRTVSLGLQGYKQDKLSLSASALTYFTLLSIVPVLALGFGIAKGFGLEAVLEKEITESFKGQEQVLSYILDFTGTMLGTAKGGVIAGLGFVLLLWSVIKLMSNIESIFNRVWDIKEPRSIMRKFTDYLTMMLLGPIFLILASSTTVFITAQISNLPSGGMFDFATPLFLHFAKIFPFLLIWTIFTILYLVMPNTKVEFRAAIIAGITAGTIFQIFQSLYVYFQAGATRISAVYGSFAALPLFLIWLQTAWFVVLLGAEISFAVQNVKLKGSDVMLKKLSINYRKKLALYILVYIIDYFKKGEKAPGVQDLASDTGLPVNITVMMLNDMTEAGIISKIVSEKNYGFQPAADTELLKISEVIKKYENFGEDYSKYIKNTVYSELQLRLENMTGELKKSDNDISLKNISPDKRL